MKEIEEKYFTSRNEIKTYKEVMTELKEDWTTKEAYKDSSTSYPCYGRGLQPNINMNTFMIQEKMSGQTKKQKENSDNNGVRAEGNHHSPKASIQTQQRCRIVSPRR
jgi:hypothetical protein